MGVAALGSVLGRGQVAQGRVAVGGVVFVLEVGDADAGFEQVGPVIAVEALLAQAVVE
jgi:hypothetical protein